MQIGRHLQKISRLGTESYSGGICLSGNRKEAEGFTPNRHGSDYLSHTSRKAGQAQAAMQRVEMNSPRSRQALSRSRDLTAIGIPDTGISLSWMGLSQPGEAFSKMQTA